MQRYSQAAENNKAPILAALRAIFPAKAEVLEVGSGSGQHALHFTAELPELRWQPTEHPAVLPVLEENLRSAGRPAIAPPRALDLAGGPWPEGPWDGVYAANVMHIVSVPLGEALLRGAAAVLRAGGLLALYGPYRFQGAFTTASNAEFDQWLKARDPESGVRDFEALCAVAASVDLEALLPQPMPANNYLLLFRRRSAPATP